MSERVAPDTFGVRGKEVVYRLALNGLDGILDRASEAMTPIAERLASCTRIGPVWV